MKLSILNFLRVLLVIFFISVDVIPLFAAGRRTYVRGYYRKDGTYVSGHFRNVNSFRTPSFMNAMDRPLKKEPLPFTKPLEEKKPPLPKKVKVIKVPMPSQKIYKPPTYNRQRTINQQRQLPFYKPLRGRRPHNPDKRIFSYSMKLRKYRAQGGRCAHCGRHGSISQMEADHIVPYSKGGRTTWSNLQILCRRCNRSKGNRYSH